MKDYFDTIEKLNNEIKSFINEYVMIDEKNKSNDLIKNLFISNNDKFNKLALETNTLLNKKINAIESDFSQSLKKSNAKQVELNKDSKNKTLEVKAKYEEIFRDIDLQIKEVEKKTEDEVSSTLFSIDSYVESSNQNIDMFELELNQSLSRYDYQIGIAKQSYDENIKNYNERLEGRLNTALKTYNTDITKCDKEYNSLVKLYKNEISQCEKYIYGIEEKYRIELFDVKEKQRTENVKLNNEIRKSLDEKNEQIAEYKKTYVYSRTLDENQKQNNEETRKQSDMQSSKEFAYNLHLIDEELSYLKNNYDEEKNNLSQELNYSLFKLHKDQENEIKASSSNIKNINKAYYKKMKIEENKFDDLLKVVDSNYNKNVSEKIYNKKVLDIERSTEMEKKKEERTRDNKYYQEKSIRYEIIRDYNASISNKNHNIKANKLRYDFNLLDIDFENEILKINADYQIEMKNQNTIIDKYNLEIDTAKKLNDLNHFYIDSIFDNANKYLTISNLLEIEKCKTLYEYNKNKYYLNVKNSKDIYEYSKRRIELGNQKYEMLNKKDIDIINKKAEMVILGIRQKSEILSINERKEYDEINNSNNFKSLEIKSQIESEKNKNDIVIFNELLSSYSILITNSAELLSNLVEAIIYNLDLEEAKKPHIKTLINNLKKIFTSFIISLSEDFKVMINDQIEKHIKFEDDFNFNIIIDKINDEYEYNNNILNMSKKEKLDNIEKINIETEELRREIYNIQYVLSKAQYKKIGGKKKINQNIQMIKQNQKIIEELENELNTIKEKALKDNINYIHNMDNITKTKADKINHYVEFKDNINLEIEGLLESIEKPEIFENDNFYSSVKSSLIKIDDKYVKNIYGVFNSFTNYSDEIIVKDISRINDENKEKLNELEESYSLIKKNLDNDYDKRNLNKQKELQYLTREKANIERTCNEIINRNEIEHNKVIKKLVIANRNITVKFYHDLYALIHNQEDINYEYDLLTKTREKSYVSEKKNIIDLAIEKINEYDKKYNEFVKQRKDLIKNIPQATKIKKIQLHSQLKKSSQDIKEKSINDKIKYNQSLKNVEKSLYRIDYNYNIAIQKIQIKSNKKISLEKKKA